MAEYHLHAKTASRGVGKGAGGHVRYVLREGPYATKQVEQVDGALVSKTRVSRADEVAYSESGNMPAWVKNPADYWDAADHFERANGSVYRELEFALPKELSEAENIALARAFAERLATVPEGKTPYTLAIHRSERDPALLHCHLMLSDKVHDGMDRDAALWFKRAAASPKGKNPVDPARGGAPKTQARISHDWLKVSVRPLWAELANEALARAGIEARIDHRSLEERRQEQERLAAEASARGDRVSARRHERAALALDRPAQPKRGKVLTHGGPEKAPGRAALVLEYEEAKAKREKARAALREAEEAMEEARREFEKAQRVAEIARERQARRGLEEEMIRRRWRERRRERAVLDQVAAETGPGIRHPQRRSWREWRAQTLARRYDPEYAAQMAERDIYCRWVPEHGGGLYLRLGTERTRQEIVDQGPLLLAKNGAQDAPLLIETAKAKGWKSLEFTGSQDFQEQAAAAALKAGLGVADADLARRAKARIEREERRSRLLALEKALREDVDARIDLVKAYTAAGFQLEKRDGGQVLVYPHADPDLEEARQAVRAARAEWDARKRARREREREKPQKNLSSKRGQGLDLDF